MPIAKLTVDARRDLKEIAKYIGRISKRPITAEQIVRAIKAKCEYYAEHPSGGKLHLNSGKIYAWASISDGSSSTNQPTKAFAC